MTMIMTTIMAIVRIVVMMIHSYEKKHDILKVMLIVMISNRDGKHDFARVMILCNTYTSRSYCVRIEKRV
jgi:hypothetical protein